MSVFSMEIRILLSHEVQQYIPLPNPPDQPLDLSVSFRGSKILIIPMFFSVGYEKEYMVNISFSG